MPLAGFGWEGEQEANNREPEDLPGSSFSHREGRVTPRRSACMSLTPILRDKESRSHDLTTISMVDSLVVTGLLCTAIWALIALTILAT